jgi:hypothetical protein
MSGPTPEQIELMRKELKRHVAQLGEQFDTVHIICTKAEADGTMLVQEGNGNWYARYGALTEVKESYELTMNAPHGDEDG